MSNKSAQVFLRQRLQNHCELVSKSATKPDAGFLNAMGLLAVAEGLESVSTSIDKLAETQDAGGVAKTLATGLSDVTAGLSDLADTVHGG